MGGSRSSCARCTLRHALAVGLVLLSGLLVACDDALQATAPVPPSTATIEPPVSDPAPTATATPEAPVATATRTPVPTPTATATGTPEEVATTCSLGTGLRRETVDLLLTYREHPGLVMSANPTLAEEVFPEFEGWIRVMGAPSIEMLEQRALRAEETGMVYEGLGYGLETSETTPEEEWQDLVGATANARTVVDQYGKLLVMAPGLRLMSQNEDAYAPMAEKTDIWIFQTQRLQRQPPGPAYREDVARIVNEIRAAHPDIVIWAQITMPPDRAPDAEEWVAYHDAISDLVDGTYIGVYIWDRVPENEILAAMETIFETICESEQ